MNETTADLATKQSKRKYVYGYDLYSESVRQYPAVNDIKAARMAVTSNINDYLKHLGEFETSPKCTKRQLLVYVLLTLVALMACGIFLRRDLLESHTWVAHALLFLVLLFTSIFIFCEWLEDPFSLIFTVPGPSSRGNNIHQKVSFRALRGRRLCLRVGEVSNSSRVTIEAQLVGLPRLLCAPSVYYSVSKEAPYGRYFSKTGFFYPPHMIEDIDMLLKSLNSALQKKKQ